MRKYILRIDEDPCNYECGMKYYKCVDAPYWQLSERTLGQLPELEKGLKAEYQRGLEDAWECARRLLFTVEDGGMSTSELCEIFHRYGSYSILKDYSVQEVMKRIEEYEKQKDAIKIGDEVKFNHDDIKATVMDQSDKEGMWWLYTENGCIEEWQDAYFRKTGRTFPQIEEVLKAMQRGES